ncbi:MAG TPA: oligoendopeptidase F, partial [Kiritimatiellia bacterium]|nr:oligoendopeptidase F [Kiritimatiellia bacterium]
MKPTPEPTAVPARADIPVELTWDLTPLYATPSAWEADFARLDELAAPVLALQGKLDSVAAVAQLLAAETALDRVLERLHTYAHLRHD